MAYSKPGPGRPPKFKSPEELQEKVDKYFKDAKVYSVTGLAVALGTDRHTLIAYGEKDEYFHTIKEAKSRIEQSYEENLLLNKHNATGSIFTLKNNFGWKDQTEQKREVEVKGVVFLPKKEDV